MSKTERLARVSERTGIGRLIRRMGAWTGVLTLTYHRVSTPDSYNPAIVDASPEGFEEQVRFLAREFDVITPDDLETVVARGRGRHVLLTFDDGYRDNFEVAFPILKSHGVPATFFVTTGFLDGRMISWWDEIAWMIRNSPHRELDSNEWFERRLSLDPEGQEGAIKALIAVYHRLSLESTDTFLESLAALTGSGRHRQGYDGWMTWDEIRELRAAGMRIGGHTVNHPVLARLPADEQEQEIVDCKRRLEQELAESIRYFSYPFGERDSFDETTRAILAENDVEYAFSLYNGYRRFEDWTPYDITRSSLGPTVTPKRVALMLTLPQLFAGKRERPGHG
jgi:peptidoglycan/xylan/chitin deacetylase (PgdA/CDA1 family)